MSSPGTGRICDRKVARICARDGSGSPAQWRPTPVRVRSTADEEATARKPPQAHRRWPQQAGYSGQPVKAPICEHSHMS